MMRVLKTAVVGIMCLIPLGLSAPETRPPSFIEAHRAKMNARIASLEQSIRRYDAYLATVQQPSQVSTVSKVRKVKVRVTACSPQDPIDLAYYAKYGYEGSAYNVAADMRQFPMGTKMRIPGYMGGKWFEVDSKGGVHIRRSANKGIHHVDVKFKTYYSAKKWGNKNLTVEYILPQDQ